MAKFEIQYVGGVTATVDGQYKVTDGGVLAVLPDSGEPFIVAPSFWQRVTVKDAPTKPAPGNLLWTD